MKRIRSSMKGIVSTRRDASEIVGLPGDVAIVRRGVIRWVIIKCPCGCGDEIPINLDERAGPAWRVFHSEKSGLTLYPSVWRDSGCMSHFILWRNDIFLFRKYGSVEDGWSQLSKSTRVLEQKLISRLPDDHLIHFSDLADDLDELPWDVLWACRALVRRKMAVEGAGDMRGFFASSEFYNDDFR